MSTDYELMDMIEWYVRCLEDVQDGRVVRGLTEAKAGYDSALLQIEARLSAVDPASGGTP